MKQLLLTLGIQLIQMVGLPGDLLQLTANRMECLHASELQVFDLPLILLKCYDPILYVPLAHFRLDVLVADFVHHEHATTSHWQGDVAFLLFGFLYRSLFRQTLKLLQSFFVFFILFLNLVTDEAHIVAGPDYWQLIRSRNGTGKHISLLHFLQLRCLCLTDCAHTGNQTLPLRALFGVMRPSRIH